MVLTDMTNLVLGGHWCPSGALNKRANLCLVLLHKRNYLSYWGEQILVQWHSGLQMDDPVCIWEQLFPPGAQHHAADTHQHLRTSQRECSSGEPGRSGDSEDLAPGLGPSAFGVHRRGCWQWWVGWAGSTARKVAQPPWCHIGGSSNSSGALGCALCCTAVVVSLNLAFGKKTSFILFFWICFWLWCTATLS